MEKRRGFTLMEVVLVLGILVILGSFTAFGSFTTYRRQAVGSERDLVLSLLWRARGRAAANLNQTDHGLRIASSSYVLFDGESYAERDPDLDETFPRNAAIDLDGDTEVVFRSPQAVRDTDASLTVGNEAAVYTIYINVEGRIDWQ